jgi:acetylxylan esterase
VGGGRDFNGTGLRSQKSLNSLMQYAKAELLRTWCNEGDPICAVGSEPQKMENHLNYFERFNNEAAQWIIETAQRNNASQSEASPTRNGDGKGVIGEQEESVASREAFAKIIFFFLIAGSIMFAMLR